MTGVRHSLRRVLCCSAAAVTAVAVAMSVSSIDANADPAADALSSLDELSRQAVQTREAVTAAQREVDASQAEHTAAVDRQRADEEALAMATTELGPHQEAADNVAAMTYISGGRGQLAAVMTATSPGQLIDRLSLDRAVAGRIADQLEGARVARERAATAAAASEKSAAEARTKAEQASAVRADLQRKWTELLRQIAAAEAQYGALSPQQQAMVDNAPPSAPTPGQDAPSLAAAQVDIPEALPMGVASEIGLQPNSILAARAVSATFPQIAEIGGVRPDSKPWHPSGLAIDIMIPNSGSPEGIALGDEILAFALNNAVRFGLQDVIWRGTYYTPSGPQATGYGHYDHVHITTTPRR